MATRHSTLLFVLLVAIGATFAARDVADELNPAPKAEPAGAPRFPGGGGWGPGYFGPGGGGGGFGFPPGFGGGWGGGYGGPGGGYGRGGVVAPTVTCSEKGPCYGKKVTCPKKCFWSYSHSGNGYGGGGGGGGCTIDCKNKCTAYC